MIQISNSDRDLILQYIEATNIGEQKVTDLDLYNLHRRVRIMARRLKAKKPVE